MIRLSRRLNHVNKAEFKAWCTATPKPVVVHPHYRGRPLLMGILNVTPDSFSDGGLFLKPDNAFKQAEKMIHEGADILDIGAESTRPGALSLDTQQELDRLIPVIELITARYDIALSVDTYKPDVMKAAVRAGAACINDVYALQKPGALAMAASLDVPVCLMHMQGIPETMQEGLDAQDDMVLRVQQFFKARIAACLAAGISQSQLILDPGFGFGKTVRQNLKLVQQLSKFYIDTFPLLLGVSRKSTIGAVLQQAVSHRLSGGLALSVYAAEQGVAIIRTHDVGETQEALQMIDVMLQDSYLDKERE
ncbi:MAG: dihydropteroate synthase [Legionellaceae bacterium]|nr:dihydropteroate synthase [Legionellaceae bacterium]